MTCFVTVGTTLFEELINKVLTDVNIENLKSLGIHKIILQIGKGNFRNEVIDRVFKETTSDEGGKTIYKEVEIEFYRYKPSLSADMENSTVIISHAGAGTCLEALKLRKSFIVVINENLMDNHQSELAVALADNAHLLYCTVFNLSETIRNPGLFTLIPFEPLPQNRVARFIDKRMGV